MTPIVLVGEFRSETEAKYDTSFASAGGVELLRMLSEAGVITISPQDRDDISSFYRFQNVRAVAAIWSRHPEIFRTNVFNLHPHKNDLEFFCGPKALAIPGYPALLKSKYVREDFAPELERLGDEILSHDPNVIICLGNTAIWALAGQSGISKVRGTTLVSTHTISGYKLLPTYHPIAVLRQWENRPTVIADLMKAKDEAEYGDIRRPTREIWIEPTLDDIRTFIESFVVGCDLLSVDIETSGARITCIGFAPSNGRALVIPFDDERNPSGCYWPTAQLEAECWSLVKSVLENPCPKLFQNGAYDISFLLRAYGIRTINAREDTMLLQHALQPESLKGLGYLGSIYSDEGAWKHMRKKVATIKRDE
jgi:hypothetical protein